MNKLLCYSFTRKGLERAVRDMKSEKTNRRMDMIFWATMIVLCFYGVVGQSALMKMATCSGTSKAVKYLIH